MRGFLNDKNRTLIGDTVLSSLASGLWAYIFMYVTGEEGKALVTGLVFGAIVACLWVSECVEEWDYESTN